MTVIDIRTEASRRPRGVQIYGANRGARGSLPHLVRFNNESQVHAIQAKYADLSPGRAEAVAALARSQGLPAQAQEVDIRDLPAADAGSMIISHVDDSLLNAEILAKNPNADVLGYAFGRTAKNQVFLVCINGAAGEAEERVGSALLSAALDRHSAAGGSEYFFGDQAPAHIREAEKQIRNFLGHNMTDIIDRRLSGRSCDPGTHIYFDGSEALRTIVLDHRQGWANPALIAHQQLGDPKFPIARGKSIIAAEIGPDAEIRLHLLRRRETNEDVTVGGVAVIDPRTVSMRSPELWAKAQQEREAALAVANANTITRRRRPVYITD